jgi:hypothetical protein
MMPNPQRDILVIFAILYFMFKGNVDRAGEKAKYHAGGWASWLKRWLYGGSRGY